MLVKLVKQSVETMLINVVVGSEVSISISAPERATTAYKKNRRDFIILSYWDDFMFTK